MPKMIFRNHEVKNLDQFLLLDLSRSFGVEPQIEEVQSEPVCPVPDMREVQEEVELFRKSWEEEQVQLRARAEREAQDLKERVEEEITAYREQCTKEADRILAQAKEQSELQISEAQQQAERMIAEAETSRQKICDHSKAEGIRLGKEEGFRAGQEEVRYLTERLHKMIEEVMGRRQGILRETERQIVDLVLLMTRKVVKVISENQRAVISANVVHALRKVRTRGAVTLRVNLADVELVTQHKQEFIAAVERVDDLTVVEDTSVGRGGCVVETDFGEIDARVASQLHELEQRVLEVAPIVVSSMSASKGS